jgi:hypothetical protein
LSALLAEVLAELPLISLPIQGKTRLEALRAAGRSDVETEVLRLHHTADFDGSGFVSDEEGERFGVLVQFGQQVDYLVMKTGGYSPTDSHS